MCVNKDHDFLEAAIDSVLQQDYINNFEFVIVANNCEDELYAKLNSYEDSRIKLFRTCIGQLCFNLNYAIDKSVGDYIIRMDSDDICLPQRLSITEDAILSNPGYEIFAFSANNIDDLGVKTGETISGLNIKKDTIFFKNTIIHPSVAIKRSLILKHGGYSGGFQSEDYDLWLRLKRANSFMVKYSGVKVLNYRIHESQSRGNFLPYAEAASYLLREFLITKRKKSLLGCIYFSIKRYIKGTK